MCVCVFARIRDLSKIVLVHERYSFLSNENIAWLIHNQFLSVRCRWLFKLVCRMFDVDNSLLLFVRTSLSVCCRNACSTFSLTIAHDPNDPVARPYGHRVVESGKTKKNLNTKRNCNITSTYYSFDLFTCVTSLSYHREQCFMYRTLPVCTVCVACIIITPT